MPDHQIRSERPWIFAAIVLLLVAGGLFIFNANSDNPGLADDNVTNVMPPAFSAGKAPAVNAINRDPVVREEPARATR